MIMGVMGVIFWGEKKLRLITGVIILLDFGFFGFGFAYAFSVFISHKPLLIINSEGILDNASPLGAGMLRWEEIAKIFPYKFMAGQYLAIIPKDLGTTLSRQRLLVKITMRINQALFKAPIFIS